MSSSAQDRAEAPLGDPTVVRELLGTLAAQMTPEGLVDAFEDAVFAVVPLERRRALIRLAAIALRAAGREPPR